MDSSPGTTIWELCAQEELFDFSKAQFSQKENGDENIAYP